MKKKSWLLGSIFLTILILLTGCVKVDKAGRPTGKGIIYNYLMKPMSNLFDWMVSNFHVQYGVVIILVTLIFRFILMPIFLNNSRNTLIQQEKMHFLKPYIEPLQKRAKSATTQEEKIAANMEVQKFYKENGINMFGMGLGCLPLLLQVPIFSALFMAVKYNPGVLKERFLVFDLSKRSLVLLGITAGLYLLQGYISLIGLEQEQKEKTRMITFLSPLFMVFFGFTVPAGVQLYWVAGGLVMVLQQWITNIFIRPKIKKQISAEFAENPTKKMNFERKDVTDSTVQKPTYNRLNQGKNKGRNSGKQNHQG